MSQGPFQFNEEDKSRALKLIMHSLDGPDAIQRIPEIFASLEQQRVVVQQQLEAVLRAEKDRIDSAHTSLEQANVTLGQFVKELKTVINSSEDALIPFTDNESIEIGKAARVAGRIGDTRKFFGDLVRLPQQVSTWDILLNDATNAFQSTESSMTSVLTLPMGSIIAGGHALYPAISTYVVMQSAVSQHSVATLLRNDPYSRVRDVWLEYETHMAHSVVSRLVMESQFNFNPRELAALLQTAAPPGSVLVTSATSRDDYPPPDRTVGLDWTSICARKLESQTRRQVLNIAVRCACDNADAAEEAIQRAERVAAAGLKEAAKGQLRPWSALTVEADNLVCEALQQRLYEEEKGFFSLAFAGLIEQLVESILLARDVLDSPNPLQCSTGLSYEVRTVAAIHQTMGQVLVSLPTLPSGDILPLCRWLAGEPQEQDDTSALQQLERVGQTMSVDSPRSFHLKGYSRLLSRFGYAVPVTRHSVVPDGPFEGPVPQSLTSLCSLVNGRIQLSALQSFMVAHASEFGRHMTAQLTEYLAQKASQLPGETERVAENVETCGVLPRFDTWAEVNGLVSQHVQFALSSQFSPLCLEAGRAAAETLVVFAGQLATAARQHWREFRDIGICALLDIAGEGPIIARALVSLAMPPEYDLEICGPQSEEQDILGSDIPHSLETDWQRCHTAFAGLKAALYPLATLLPIDDAADLIGRVVNGVNTDVELPALTQDQPHIEAVPLFTPAWVQRHDTYTIAVLLSTVNDFCEDFLERGWVPRVAGRPVLQEMLTNTCAVYLRQMVRVWSSGTWSNLMLHAVDVPHECPHVSLVAQYLFPDGVIWPALYEPLAPSEDEEEEQDDIPVLRIEQRERRVPAAMAQAVDDLEAICAFFAPRTLTTRRTATVNAALGLPETPSLSMPLAEAIMPLLFVVRALFEPVETMGDLFRARCVPPAQLLEHIPTMRPSNTQIAQVTLKTTIVPPSDAETVTRLFHDHQSTATPPTDVPCATPFNIGLQGTVAERACHGLTPPVPAQPKPVREHRRLQSIQFPRLIERQD